MPPSHINLPLILTLSSLQSTSEIRRVTSANSAKHHLRMLRVICENWVDQIVIKPTAFDRSALNLSSSALSLGFFRQIVSALSSVSLNCLSSILSLLNWLILLHLETISMLSSRQFSTISPLPFSLCLRDYSNFVYWFFSNLFCLTRFFRTCCCAYFDIFS
jgi:hypothetical protein